MTGGEFWTRVDIRGDDECWEWQGGRSGNYGEVWWNGHEVGAHRVAWEITHGAIPERRWVLHKCDNPPCCNPAHLFLGTPKDNAQDAMYKGRMWNEEQRRKNGDFHRGKVISDEHRRKVGAIMSKVHKGKPLSEEHRHKIGDAQKGKQVSEETRRKIGIASKGRHCSEETRRKISQALSGNTIWRGKHHSKESNRKNSESHKGKRVSDDTKWKMSESNKGKHRSEDAKRNMREAWVHRRAAKFNAASETTS